MLLPAGTGLGVPVMVMPTTAEVTTGVVTVAECGLVESVGLDTVAVSVMFVPLGVLEMTCTTTVNVAEPPAARVAVLPLMVPVPPAGGVLKGEVGPPVWPSATEGGLARAFVPRCTVLAAGGAVF